MRRAAVAGDADGDAVDGEPDRFLGEEHERRSPGLGGADGDEEGDRDLLGVLESGGQADDCLACHDVSPSSVVRRWLDRPYGRGGVGVVRGSPYRSSGSRVSSRPCCMANSVAVERVEAPVLA